MTSFQKLGYSTLATIITAESAFAASSTEFFGKNRANDLSGGTSTNGYEAIISVIRSLLQFVTIIAVAYVLWAGFQILTAGGDDDKVKSGRKTIIQVIIGIVVMWLAFSVVTWIMGGLV